MNSYPQPGAKGQSTADGYAGLELHCSRRGCIRLDTDRYLLYAAVNTKTNESPHVRLFSITNYGLRRLLVREFSENQYIDDAMFLDDAAVNVSWK